MWNNNKEIILNKNVKTYKTDEKNIIIPKVNCLKVMQAIQKVHLYEKYYKNRDGE